MVIISETVVPLMPGLVQSKDVWHCKSAFGQSHNLMSETRSMVVDVVQTGLYTLDNPKIQKIKFISLMKSSFEKFEFDRENKVSKVFRKLFLTNELSHVLNKKRHTADPEIMCTGAGGLT